MTLVRSLVALGSMHVALFATPRSRATHYDFTARLAAVRAYAEAHGPFGLRGVVTIEHDGVEQLALGIGRVAAGGAPITPDSVFDLGSNSKCFTAAAMVLLVDRGEIALDDSLAKLL